ncbi:MAG: tetratricopeptide repeat protein [Myxococcales bacterium]|nr:tetratricopeptide repeat protein [Myxococcales bacterium]MDH3843637.1 tetratricopeptide repeat protein [Myxococcales bacterium]
MPLDSTDAYVLSRIDGVTLAHEIVDACGLDTRTVTEVLNRLTAMGLIQWTDEAPASEVSEPSSDRPGGRVSGTRISTKRNIEAIRGATPQLLEGFERLTHYQLLGLYSDCADHEIKLSHMRARNLEEGTLAARMAARLGAERVLARVFTAYEVLRSSQGRRKYDEYLLYREETRAIEDALSEGVRRASLVPSRAPSSTPVSKGGVSKEDSMVPPHLPAESITADHLVAALREHAPRGARRKRAEGLVRDAIAEREADNLVGATNALRLANSILPDCTALEGALATVTREMNESLAPTLRAQAMYEENLQMWEAAAETWEKVLLGQSDDARAALGVAQALLEAGGDLKRARRRAEEAVKAAPEDAECRRTLARVYIAAGMTKSAQRALNIADSLERQENNRRGVLSRVSARWRRS